jgi:hypothetical protein
VSEVAVLVGAVLSPLLALGLLLWLTHLEDTLPLDVHAAQRKPAPPPILAFDIPSPTAADAVEAVEPAVQAFSRSARLSLGGSTNR